MESHLERLAPWAFLLISLFLSYPSQYLFLRLDPAPLSTSQIIGFNIEIILFYLSYARTVWTSPGTTDARPLSPSEKLLDRVERNYQQRRWCKKCNQAKPPRAHHCKVCRRCVLKMDHHCPWAANCVGHCNLPHFTRFLFFSAVGMVHLGSFIFTRWASIWDDRHLASSLGPSSSQLIHLMAVTVVNAIAGLVVFMLLFRAIWDLGGNMTRIEVWEMERHEALLRRARARGGVVHGPGGITVKIVRHEFPYDIGIFANIAQAMGSRNPLIWFWPFAASPTSESGLEFETNDFNEPGMTWPPPDPDRMPQPMHRLATKAVDDDILSRDQQPDAFRARQQQDLARRRHHASNKSDNDLFEDEYRSNDACPSKEAAPGRTRKWRNADSETLDDLGVDEEAEYDANDDDIPLSQLTASHKSHQL